MILDQIRALREESKCFIVGVLYFTGIKTDIGVVSSSLLV